MHPVCRIGSCSCSRLPASHRDPSPAHGKACHRCCTPLAARNARQPAHAPRYCPRTCMCAFRRTRRGSGAPHPPPLTTRSHLTSRNSSPPWTLLGGRECRELCLPSRSHRALSPACSMLFSGGLLIATRTSFLPVRCAPLVSLLSGEAASALAHQPRDHLRTKVRYPRLCMPSTCYAQQLGLPRAGSPVRQLSTSSLHTAIRALSGAMWRQALCACSR